MEVCLEVLLEFVFLPTTSKFWSRGPYRDPHWSCSKALKLLCKEKHGGYRSVPVGHG
jgi:hypothetical protein